jgi:hypothetical protein
MPLAFVISPQPWNGFLVSKHHYALTLAFRGWEIFFIDPPTDLGGAGRMKIQETDVTGLSVLRYQTFFPYALKFRFRALFDNLMRKQARRITEKIGRPDLVWDFDNAYQFADLKPFEAGLTFFHLVDDIADKCQGTRNADHFFYLDESFCRHAGGNPTPGCQVGHGLSKAHEIAARNLRLEQYEAGDKGAPRIGFVGNLAAAWIDWDAVLEMLRRNPNAHFTFWGPMPGPGDANATIKDIASKSRVSFRGLTSPDQIIEDSGNIDIWIFPFCSDKLLGGPTDSHKILEYLSTGKAVVMNWLRAYESSELVYMAPAEDKNVLPDLLDEVLSTLPEANSVENMERRRNYALERTYDKRLDHIFSVAGVKSHLL